MVQNALTSLVATVNNGTQFLNEHEALKANVLTLHSGASRPAYALAGTAWLKIVSSTAWELRLFDGTDDILAGTFEANTFTPAGLSSGVEPGTGAAFFGSVAPAGWLLCYRLGALRRLEGPIWPRGRSSAQRAQRTSHLTRGHPSSHPAASTGSGRGQVSEQQQSPQR
jgi:hypothetical protein